MNAAAEEKLSLTGEQIGQACVELHRTLRRCGPALLAGESMGAQYDRAEEAARSIQTLLKCCQAEAAHRGIMEWDLYEEEESSKP